MARGVRAHDKAAERVPHEHVAFARRDLCEHYGELVDNPVERPRPRRRVTPSETRAIVRTDTREFRDLRLDDGPTERRSGDPGFEQHHWTALARAHGMQPMATNVNQATWRTVPLALPPSAEALIEGAKQDQRDQRHQNTDDAHNCMVNPSGNGRNLERAIQPFA